MASMAPEIPIQYLRADQKFQVIAWINTLNLPQRFARKVLQDWGEAVGVTLDSTAYELVSRGSIH
jgi:hypothetical protein